jgi:hypothetical protein
MNTKGVQNMTKLVKALPVETEYDVTNIPSNNGDKYWECQFNVQESIARTRNHEGRGIEVKVRCGLDLYWAKGNLYHGDWYPYLKKACINPSKATRRMQVSKEFMIWVRILQLGEQPKEHKLIAAMELIHSEPCKLHDFAQYKANNLDLDQFLAEVPPGNGGKVKPLHDDTIMAGLYAGKVVRYVSNHWSEWSLQKQSDVAEEIRLSIDMLQGLLATLRDGYKPYDPDKPLVSATEMIQRLKEKRDQGDNDDREARRKLLNGLELMYDKGEEDQPVRHSAVVGEGQESQEALLVGR